MMSSNRANLTALSWPPSQLALCSAQIDPTSKLSGRRKERPKFDDQSGQIGVET